MPELEELFVAGYLPHYGMSRFDFNMLQHLDRLYYFSIAPDTLGNYIMPENHQQNIDLLNTELSDLSTELLNTSPRAILYSYIVKQSSPDRFENKYGKYGYNGRELMVTKTEYLIKYNYYGIMAWKLSQEVNYSSDYNLLKSIVNTAK